MPRSSTPAFALLVAVCLAGGDAGAAPAGTVRALRIGASVRGGVHSLITPLVYWGGFQTKTACYEGLTRYGPRGELLPGLAESWDVSGDGRVYTIRLRKDVVFHDGRPLDAETVRNHLMRWRGNFANSWIGTTLRFDEIEAVDALTVRVTLHEPWPFLEEAASAINPAFVVGKGAYTHEGAFARAVGTGPYRLEAVTDEAVFDFRANEKWWRGRPTVERIEMVPLPRGHRESPLVLEVLRKGEVDLVADGSSPLIPRDDVAALLEEGGYRLFRSHGTAVTYLVLHTERGPLANVEARRALAVALDRKEHVEKGELGYAIPATTLFAPGTGGWPESGRTRAPAPAYRASGKLRILMDAESSRRMMRHAEIVARQARAAGFSSEVVVPASAAEAQALDDRGEWEIRFGTTYGLPYDPWVTLQTTFLDRPAGETASSRSALWVDRPLRDALLAGFTSPQPGARAEAFQKIQARLDDQLPLVPLFISDRLVVARGFVTELPMDGDGYDLRLGDVRTAELPERPSMLAHAAGVEPPPPPPAPPADPSQGEVPLPAMNGWKAALVLDNEGVGVWALGCFRVFPLLGCPDVVGVDDRGRCHVLTSYSGRWSDVPIIAEGAWFNAIEHGDIDLRVEGAELYTGGQMGNVYQILAYRHRRLDYRLISFLRGYEANILLAADFLPDSPGQEILVFTNPPAVVMLTPTGRDGTFEEQNLGDVDGLVREAVVLPGAPGALPRVACVSRAGWLRILTIGREGMEWQEIHRDAMGLGRISLRPAQEGDGIVLYTALDDGRILRHERSAAGEWETGTIYLGPLGPRGVTAGRFDDDPETETVAIFGYSHEVELLARKDGEWTVRTIYVEKDKGHSLLAAELDGRNGTDEILLSGYGGRIVLLARPVGYGRKELARPDR